MEPIKEQQQQNTRQRQRTQQPLPHPHHFAPSWPAVITSVQTCKYHQWLYFRRFPSRPPILNQVQFRSVLLYSLNRCFPFPPILPSLSSPPSANLVHIGEICRTI